MRTNNDTYQQREKEQNQRMQEWLENGVLEIDENGDEYITDEEDGLPTSLGRGEKDYSRKDTKNDSRNITKLR